MHKYIRIILVLINCLFLTGCYVATMGTAMVITSPEKLALQAERPRYFSLDMEVDIHDKKYQINHIWRCDNQKEFSAGSMHWGLYWESSSRGIVKVKIFPDNSAIVFNPPYECDMTGGEKYQPDLVYIKNIDNFYSFELYPHDLFDHTVIRRGLIQRLAQPAEGSVLTKREQEIGETLKGMEYRAVAVGGRVMPEEIWRKSPKLAVRLERMTKLTIAEPTRNQPNTKLFDDVPKTWRGAIDFVDRGSEWVGNNKLPVNSFYVYHFYPDIQYGETRHYTLNYEGESFNIGGASVTQIYDPSTRSIIFLDSSPWLYSGQTRVIR